MFYITPCTCAGDHFYKENPSLSLEEQMITAVPDVKSRQLQNDDEFVVVACDGIWYYMYMYIHV